LYCFIYPELIKKLCLSLCTGQMGARKEILIRMVPLVSKLSWPQQKQLTAEIVQPDSPEATSLELKIPLFGKSQCSAKFFL
jgi:hypothetical protein